MLRFTLTRYSTTIYENRFVVGGVAERIIGAIFVALGHRASNIGVTVTRSDILVGDARLSVKGSFQSGSRSIRLVNVMGSSTGATWQEPTIVIMSNVGIGYADPELLPGEARRRTDVIELPATALRRLWQAQPDYLVQIIIPVALQDASRSDVASRIVADEILRYTKRLRPFDPRTPAD